MECSLLVLITNLKRLKPFIRQAKLLRKTRWMAERWETTIRIMYTASIVPIGNLNISPQIRQNLTHFQINCEICRLCPNSETNNMIHGSYTVPQKQSNGFTYARRCGFKYTTGRIWGVNTDGSEWMCSHYNRATCYLASLSWIMYKRVAVNNSPPCSNE